MIFCAVLQMGSGRVNSNLTYLVLRHRLKTNVSLLGACRISATSS
jgi:hypothetical protein